MQDFPPFPGFRDEAFAFLRDLKKNNDRGWFKPRKATFDDELVWPMRCLLTDASRRASEAGLPLTADPKKSIFRIYRDTRFSNNKDPYKTHLGAVLSRTGSHKDAGVVYIHVEPGASFLGAGFYRLEKALLDAWRGHLIHAPAVWLDVVEQLKANGMELSTTDDSLTRLPRGFETYADADIAEYLRWKSFLVGKQVPDDALRAPDFTDEVLRLAHGVMPLLDYGWEREDSTTLTP